MMTSAASQPIGILLTNIGTPDAPTPSAVKRYLAEFLSDPAVVHLPRLLWLPILHSIVLTRRPKRSAQLYQKIWTPEGSPLRVHAEHQIKKLQIYLDHHKKEKTKIVLGMRYGNPSLEKALSQLNALSISKILIFPLYPQYSFSTTLSTMSRIQKILKKWKWKPDIYSIENYYQDPGVRDALVQTIQNHWHLHGKPDYFIFSFHGIPVSQVKKGDPYPIHCFKTAESIATVLGLDQSNYAVTFQSRFGFNRWLTPDTGNTLINIAKQNKLHVNVICPGFSSDCLETLEEVNIGYRTLYENAGGRTFHYIPALNATDAHIQALGELICKVKI